ncbi:MAG: hypothetical protein ACLUF5_03910 [Clostridia bacterium]
MMNLSQTKLVGLTMELDLKTREYKKLCDKLDELKEKRIDPNDERLLVVKELFQKNHDDIVEINRQIKEVKETEELKEKQKLEQYNPENIFNKKNDTSKTKKEENMDISVVQSKQNIFVRFIEKIKSFFKK